MTGTAFPNEPQFLEVPETKCVAAADRLPWYDQQTVYGAPWDLGIKCNTPETSQLVARLLSAISRPGLVSPYANLRVSLHEAEENGSGEDLNVLYHKCKPALRSRNPRRVLEALIGWVDSYRHAARDDLLAVNAQVLAREGTCALVTFDLDRDLRLNRRRLVSSSLVSADSPIVLIDVETAEVVFEPPAFSVDTGVLTEVDRAIDPGDRTLAAGRYPIDRILVRSRTGSGEMLPRSRGIYSLAASVTNRTVLGPERVLHDLSTLVDGVSTVGWSGRADDAIAAMSSDSDAVLT